MPNDKAWCKKESISSNSELIHPYFTEQFNEISSDFPVCGTQELADTLTAARDGSGLISVKHKGKKNSNLGRNFSKMMTESTE